MSEQGSLSPLFTWRSAIASRESALPATVRHVALTLSLHMNERGGSCFPSIDTLAEETGLSDRSVQRSIAELRDRGWLLVKAGGSPRGGKRLANTYRAVFPDSYLTEAGEAGTERPVTEVRGSGSRPVTRATATGDTVSPQDVKRGRKEQARAQGKVERLEAQRRLERWLEVTGRGYAEDRSVFHEEIGKLGIDPDYAEELRLELLEKVDGRTEASNIGEGEAGEP